MKVMADPRRSEFGDFLRSRREKLSPKAVGLPTGRRRRTAGLRREEVAELAGIGVDWYIRLEQGRTVSPSVTTIDALARALRLGKAEHAHLRALASDADRRAFSRENVPDAIRRLVDNLNQPAYITGRRWDVLAWNAAAEEIFAFGRLAEEDRNTLISVLTNPQTRGLFGAACSARPGPTRPNAWSPNFVPRTIFGPAIPPFSAYWSDFGKVARSLRSGGRRTTSAASRLAANC
jgi:transcriptional regulator with XRE-family HTH domain